MPKQHEIQIWKEHAALPSPNPHLMPFPQKSSKEKQWNTIEFLNIWYTLLSGGGEDGLQYWAVHQFQQILEMKLR